MSSARGDIQAALAARGGLPAGQQQPAQAAQAGPDDAEERERRERERRRLRGEMTELLGRVGALEAWKEQAEARIAALEEGMVRLAGGE